MAENASECTVYCRWWCGECIYALGWLRKMGYDFTEVDIEEYPKAADRVREIAGKIITPVFEIGERTIVGFDPSALTEALGPARTRR